MSRNDHEALWSARYRDAGDEYLFGTAPNRFLAAQAGWFGAGMSVLSVADGEGRNSVWLAGQGCSVTVTEISQLAGMKQAVRPGGLLFLEGYTPKQLEYGTGGPSAVENPYTGALLREAFADWEIVLLREYEDVMEEGRAHSGRSALIDLVARKPATGR